MCYNIDCHGTESTQFKFRHFQPHLLILHLCIFRWQLVLEGSELGHSISLVPKFYQPLKVINLD